MFHDIVFSHDILSHIEITSSKASNFKYIIKYIEYLATVYVLSSYSNAYFSPKIYHI